MASWVNFATFRKWFTMLDRGLPSLKEVHIQYSANFEASTIQMKQQDTQGGNIQTFQQLKSYCCKYLGKP